MPGNPPLSTVPDPTIRSHLKEAQNASHKAYAKYSEFFVGAVVLTKNGNLYTGCNVENGSYGLTICAERNAVFAAVAAEGRTMKIAAVALYARSEKAFVTVSPCGACRQVLYEFHDAKHPASVTFLLDGSFETIPLADLLPHPFKLAPDNHPPA